MAIAMVAHVGVAFAGPEPENDQQAGFANVAKPEGGARDVVQRLDMRVSGLHAGAEAAEVERVLGRPTITTVFEGSSGDNRALVYADQPVRTRATLTGGRVTAIAH
jgi:hypothetical protein